MTNHDRIRARFLESVAWWKAAGRGPSSRLVYWAGINLTRTISRAVLNPDTLENCLDCRRAGHREMALEHIVMEFRGCFSEEVFNAAKLRMEIPVFRRSWSWGEK